MAIGFVSRKRNNPQDLKAEGKYYPSPAYFSEIAIEELSTEISYGTTLTPTEVVGVIKSLMVTIPKYIMLGYKVRLDGLGIFKAGFVHSGKGHEKSKDVSASDITKGIKILYTPDVMIKERIKNPSFVKTDAKYLVEEDLAVDEVLTEETQPTLEETQSSQEAKS